MKRIRMIITLMTLIITAFSSFSFAAGENIYDIGFKSSGSSNASVDISGSYDSGNDYKKTVSIGNSEFNAGEFDIDLELNNIEWLGITNKRIGKIKLKTGASQVDLNQKIPNLKVFALKNEIARSNLVGYTFVPSVLGEWDTSTGKWVVDYNTPETHIREAFDILTSKKQGFITVKKVSLKYDGEIGDWMDNMLFFSEGASIQIGKSVMKLEKPLTIDDIYDEVKRSKAYKSDFAKLVNRIKDRSSYETSDEDKIIIQIPKGSYVQAAETRITATKNIKISISSDIAVQTDPVKQLHDAVSEVSFENSVYVCDADKVFDGGFAVINELVGVLATNNAQIDVTAYCPHNESDSVIVGKKAATIHADGYTGDTVCVNCEEELVKGQVISKLKPSIKLNSPSLNMKTGQTNTSLSVSFAAGDSISSVTSSNTGLVSAAKSGTNGIRLTASRKTGSATVTVKLASGLSANATIRVESAPCTKIKVAKTKITLKKKKTYQIKPVISPAACVQKVTYKSSNRKVASVSSKGKIKALKKGKAKITVKCGTKKQTIKVTVK